MNNMQTGAQYESQQMNKLMKGKTNMKSSLCRFYLRGNCPFTNMDPQCSQLPSYSNNCDFAHGIQELQEHFVQFDEHKQKQMKQVYYNFRHNHPLNQLDCSVPEENKNYVNLYQFQYKLLTQQNLTSYSSRVDSNSKKSMQCLQKMNQKDIFDECMGQNGRKPAQIASTQNQKKQFLGYDKSKIYSLQQINSNRNLKIAIRNKFHHFQFRLFLQLIQSVYKNYDEQQVSEQQYAFCHEIVQLEYFRVGFNKLMTRIKLSFLFDYLQYSHRNGHFKFVSLMPPSRNKPVTYYLKIAGQQEIIQHYARVYCRIHEKNSMSQQQISEQQIKNQMIKEVREWWRIPPLNEVLRMLKCTFKQFVNDKILSHQYFISNGQRNQRNWITQQSVQIAKIHKIIWEQIKIKQYCIVATDILPKSSKFSRSMVQRLIANQRQQKYELVAQNQAKTTILRDNDNNIMNKQEDVLVLIKFPNVKTQIITKIAYLNAQNKYKYLFGLNSQPRNQQISDTLQSDFQIVPSTETVINNKQLIDRQEVYKNKNKRMSQLQMNEINSQRSPQKNKQRQAPQIYQQLKIKKSKKLSDYCIIQIQSVKQLSQNYEKYLRKSKVLGIDLQGSLTDSENGYLSLIQISQQSSHVILLIDFLTISKNESDESIQQARQILRKVFSNDQIVKIIHDSRNDAQCLYYLLRINKKLAKIQSLQSGIYQQKNTTPMNQFQILNVFDTAACQQVIYQLYNPKPHKLSTPGLNEVLQKYGQAPNYLKQKYHAIWQQGKMDPSIQRPMSQQFKEYCCLDVLGLHKIYTQMCKKVNPSFLKLISQIHANWSHKKVRTEFVQKI